MNNTLVHIPSEKLYKMYSDDILRYSFSILRDYEEAKDMVQEVFIRHFENEQSFKGACSYKTWLLIITRNLFYSKIKSKSFTNERVDEELNDSVFEVNYEINISIKDALMKIPSEYSELLYLKEAEGYSYEEISQITETSLDNVAVRLHRAKKMLRKILKDRY
ncbi:MAG TPA: RNA polymerase sigma factor [Ignavibacteriales bacterium]|nr:RNA polymerase sigma factor [Ignavibacteriales bacterium]